MSWVERLFMSIVTTVFLFTGVTHLCRPKAVSEWYLRHPWFWLCAGMYEERTRVVLVFVQGMIALPAGLVLAMFLTGALPWILDRFLR